MILAVAATEFEMEKLFQCPEWPMDKCETLTAGVGLLETAVRLSRCLQDSDHNFKAVVNFGVGGAYLQPPSGAQIGLLELCLAEREVLGDFGISYGDEMEPLPQELVGSGLFHLDKRLYDFAGSVLEKHGQNFTSGTFITVNGVSGTRKRGDALGKKFHGVCENMEGAAVARVCEEFSIPMVELRCISNYVEDRNLAGWKLQEACIESGRMAALIIKEIVESI